jgi:hypothetical protein
MGVRFSSLLPKLWVHTRLNSKALRSSLHRTFTVIAAAIITNWLFVRALIAGGLATTYMSQRLCVSGA